MRLTVLLSISPAASATELTALLTVLLTSSAWAIPEPTPTRPNKLSPEATTFLSSRSIFPYLSTLNTTISVIFYSQCLNFS